MLVVSWTCCDLPLRYRQQLMQEKIRWKSQQVINTHVPICKQKKEQKQTKNKTKQRTHHDCSKKQHVTRSNTLHLTETHTENTDRQTYVPLHHSFKTPLFLIGGIVRYNSCDNTVEIILPENSSWPKFGRMELEGVVERTKV